MRTLLVLFAVLSTLSFRAQAQQLSDALDTTVAVPDPIREKAASITITGEPGSGQENDTVAIGQLLYDAKGNLGKSLGAGKKSAPLGEEQMLPAGKYVIQYSGSVMEVDLAVGEHRIISLQKLNVPRVDGSYKFEAFWDLSNAEEQKLMALVAWFLPENLTFSYHTTDCYGNVTSSWTETRTFDQLCRSASSLLPNTRRYCAAYRGGDYTKLIGTLLKFNKDATYENLVSTWTRPSGGPADNSSEYYKQNSRQVLASGRDGEFVSLLPGTYGLHLTNISGKSTDKTGIVLSEPPAPAPQN